MPLDPSALVKRQLLRSVLDGTFTPGMKLPTIRQLARTLRVSSKTVQQAVHELRKEGVLTAKRGVGMTVQPTAPLASRGKKVALLFPQRASYLDGLPYPGKLIAAMERRLAQDGYAIVRFSLAHQDAMNALEALERLRLCGLICFEVDNDPLLLDLRAMRLPMISIFLRGLPLRGLVARQSVPM